MGGIGDNMKKILGPSSLIRDNHIILFFTFLCVNLKTYFDEIYQETEKTYRSNNILRKIDGFEIRSLANDSEYFAYTPSGKYQTRLGDYKDISVSF